MSIIISKPAGVAFEKNKVNGEIIFTEPVAINYVYSNGHKLIYKKNNCLKKSIWKELGDLKKYPTLIYICENDDLLNLKKSNWCPLFLDKNVAIMAAGEIGQVVVDFKFLKNFIIKYLKPVIQKMPKFLSLSASKWMIERVLSFEAAMIILDSKGKIDIFNRSFGTDYDQMWVFDSFTNSVQYQRTDSSPYGHYFR